MLRMSERENKFWELIEEHRTLLWRFSLGITRSREDALDLVSETVLAAHKNFEKLRDLQAFRSSLFTIAIRLHRRKKWRRRIFGELEEGHIEPATVMGESSHDLELLKRALDALPERQRQTILLFEISGLSLEEIREIQGDSLSAVKSRLVRGREALRMALQDDYSPLAPSKSLTSRIPFHSNLDIVI